MRPAAVTSTRSSVKKRRGWTGCLSNTLLPFSLDKAPNCTLGLSADTPCDMPGPEVSFSWEECPHFSLISKPVYIQKPWFPRIIVKPPPKKTVFKNIRCLNKYQFLPSIRFGFAQSFPLWVLLCKTVFTFPTLNEYGDKY